MPSSWMASRTTGPKAILYQDDGCQRTLSGVCLPCACAGCPIGPNARASPDFSACYRCLDLHGVSSLELRTNFGRSGSLVARGRSLCWLSVNYSGKTVAVGRYEVSGDKGNTVVLYRRARPLDVEAAAPASVFFCVPVP